MYMLQAFTTINQSFFLVFFFLSCIAPISHHKSRFHFNHYELPYSTIPLKSWACLIAFTKTLTQHDLGAAKFDSELIPAMNI